MITINNLRTIMQLRTIMFKNQNNPTKMIANYSYNNHSLNEIHNRNYSNYININNCSNWFFFSFSFSARKHNEFQQQCNPHQNNKDQQQSIKIQQQQREKIQKNKILQQRVNKIKEENEQEQLERIKEKVQLTHGKFNPLTQYFWLYRKPLFALFLIIVVLESVRQFVTFSGVYEDPFTKKKKWMIINSKQEQKLSNFILSIFKKEKDFMNINSSSNLNNKKLSQSCQRLKQKLRQMTKKYLNLDGQNQEKQFNIHVIDQQDCTLTILPGNNIIISKKMLTCSQINEDSLLYVTFLLYSLFLRRYHVKELGIREKSCFTESQSTLKNIKLSKIYTRNYSSKEIAQTVSYILRQLQQFRNKLIKYDDSQNNNPINTNNTDNIKNINNINNTDNVDNADNADNVDTPTKSIQNALLSSLETLSKIAKNDQLSSSLYHRLNLSKIFDKNQLQSSKPN